MLLDHLKSRWSVRRFEDRPIPETVLQEILEAGRLSPSVSNIQPWRFGVVTQPVLIQKLADASYGQQWMAGAPLIIVLCAVILEDEAGGRDTQVRRYPHLAEAIETLDLELYAALNLEEHHTKIAGTQMAMVALEHGIGCTWVSRFNVPQVSDLLGLLEGWLPAEMLVFGYPAESPRMMEKKPLDELVFYNRFML